jgi:hypothetical protein
MADDPELTDGDYPTEETLDRIRTTPPRDALALAERAWHYDGWATRELDAHERALVHADPGEAFLRFATGGWSGNESLIDALEANLLVRALCWRLSSRGGLHIYEIPG